MVSARRAGRPIVIYRLGSLGDTIVALPCFHAVERAFPHAPKLVLTNIPVNSKAAPLEGILGGSGLIDGTLAYPVGTRSLGELWRLGRQLRGLGADTLVYLTPARGLKAAWRDWLYFKLCGFKHIIGIPLSNDLQHNRVLQPDGRLEQEACRLARCMSDLGSPDLNDPSVWSLSLTPAEQAGGERMVAAFAGRDYLAINMGGKVAKNDWGPGNWESLLTRLAPQCSHLGLLVVGAAEDSPRAEAACRLWQGPAVNACGQLSPRESAAAMRPARLFVGHDSGPMHLAAAMGVPCVGLFGDNNPPAKWHPFGKHHQVIHRMTGVKTISVDEVLDAATKGLARTAS